MFDREGFMEYVGEKSGNSYASGLARIEKMYSVDLDGEYEKDKCDVLLKQIEQDKHRDGLSAKDSNLNQISAKINSGVFRSYNFTEIIEMQRRIYEELCRIGGCSPWQP